MKKALLVLALLGPGARARAQLRPLKTENVILVTIDGLRWQEVFGGGDPALLGHRHRAGPAAPAPARRQALMPFLWTTVAAQGQLYGNRAYGNYVNVTNKARLSYPGYNELLTGFAADQRIRNNAKIDNPNATVLEFINCQPAFRGRVAVYGSWDAFPFILNTKRSGLPVNAGLVPAAGPALTAAEQALNARLRALPPPPGGERPDALTFAYALEQLRRAGPRVLYLALGDTDEQAHAGHYAEYAQAAHAADQYLAQLWAFVQSDPRYRGKTTLLVTTDHGRGGNRLGQWTQHSRLLRGSDQTWLAVLGPDTPPTGEQRAPGQLYQHQLAQTLAALLGLRYANTRATGAPIEAVLGPALLAADAGEPGPPTGFAPPPDPANR